MNKLDSQKDIINYNVITIIQVIMSIIVMGIHTNLFKNIDNEIIVTLWNTLSLLAVPFFFYTSAWFFSHKLAKNKKEKYIELTRQQLLKYIKIYIIWNIIYLPITYFSIIENFDDYGLIKTILYYIYGLFIKGEQYYSWPLWYLLSIIYAFIYFYVLQKKSKNEKWIYIFGFIDLFVMYIINVILLNNGFGVIDEKIIKIFNTLFSDRPFKGFFYMSFGMLIYKNRDKIFTNIKTSQCLIGFTLSFIIYFFSMSTNLNYIFRPICSSLLFITIIKIAYNCKNNLNIISQYSLRKVSIVIYYTHMIFFFVYGLLTNNLEDNGGIFAFVVCLISTILMSIIIINLKNNKLIKIIF